MLRANDSNQPKTFHCATTLSSNDANMQRGKSTVAQDNVPKGTVHHTAAAAQRARQQRHQHSFTSDRQAATLLGEEILIHDLKYER